MSQKDHAHFDQNRRRINDAPPAVDAYLDARGEGRPAKSILDHICRDASVLDDLARDREWIDAVRSPAATPDQTQCILGRLGVNADQFNPRRHRFALLSRRLSAAAVLVLAFVVGMWTRSSMTLTPVTQPVETAHRFERVIESLPIQMDPFDRMRGIMFDVGSNPADPDLGSDPQLQSVRTARSSESDQRPHAPTRATVIDRPHSEPAPSEFINEDIDIETLKAIYKDLGIV